MKNILNYALLLLLSLSIVSCVDTYDDDFSEQNLEAGWIQFENSGQGELLPFANPVSSVDVLLESLNRNGTTFTYDLEVIEGSANVETGSFEGVILEGQRSGIIEIPVDFESTNGYTIEITLTGVNRDNINLGIANGDSSNPAHSPIVHTLTYSGFPLNTYAAVATVGGDIIDTFEVDLVETLDPKSFNMSSLWGPNFVAGITGDPSFGGQFVYPGTLTVGDDNRSITLVSTDTSVQDPDNPDSPLRFPGGEGSVNAATGVISYTLQQNLFQGDFEIDVELTPIVD